MSVSRRALAQGAAWTVPAVAVAAAAPSMAASLLTCSLPQPPSSNQEWSLYTASDTTSTGGGNPTTTTEWWGNSSRQTWGNTNPCSRGTVNGCVGYPFGFSSNKDNHWANSGRTVLATRDQWVLAYAPVYLTAGHTYTWTFQIYAGYGNQLTTSQPQSATIGISKTATTYGTTFTGGTFTPSAAGTNIVNGAVRTTAAQFSTRTAYQTGYNLLSISQAGLASADQYWWGQDNPDTYTVSYTPTASDLGGVSAGFMYLQYYFVIPPDKTVANDDILIGLPTMTCV